MSLRLLFRLSLLLWIPLFVILLFLPAGASENREESPPSVYFAPPAFEHLNCGTDHLLEHWPDEQVRRQEELEIAYQKWARERPDPVDRRAAEARFSPPPYELPIVFHILHNNGPENISDARILRSLDQLNASMANLAYYDQGTGVNTQIQFCLAQRSPENLPSNGITRQVTPLTELDADTEDITLKNLARWTTSAYVNVYVVREICGLGFGCGVAGYAYLPGAHGGPADGIVIEARWLGNGEANNSVLTHEVGHYLGLQHTFRGGCTNDDCLADGDLVCDTPPDNSTSPVPCSGSVNTCTTDTDSGFATDQPDMFINYMDYGFFNCYSAFTAGQSGRMSFFIDNTRASLLNSFGCQPPCPAPVIASLTGAPSGELLVGDAVNLISTSTGATSLNWFVNGNLEFSGPNFNFTFTAPGTYTITLVAASASPALCAADEQTITVEVVCPYTPDITSADQFPVEFTTVNYSTTADAPFYEWTVDGAVVSNQASVDYFFPGSGIYELCLRKGMGSCEQTACRTIFVTNVYQPCTGQTFAQNITVQLDEDDLGFQPFYSAIELDGADLALAGANSNAIYFAKVTAIGQPIWSRRIVFDDIFVPSGVTQQVENFHFYIDNAGNYLFFGSYGPELNGKNILVKYDPTNDQLVFARSFHLPTHFALHIDQQPGSSDYFLINRQTNTAATNWQLEFFTVDGNTGDFTGSNINQSWALPGTRALFTRDAQWYNGRLYTTSTMGTNNTVETGDATSVQAFDANGQLIWSRVMFEGLNGQRNLFADRLWVDEDGILSVSRQRDINGVASVQFFNKLDLNGAVEWQRAFFINQNERIVSVKRFQGGYLALLNFGATASPAASSIGLMLIDAQGDLIWSASYGDDYSPQFENSQHLLTAGEFIFLVGGRSTSSATTPTDNQSFLYRLNNAGSFQDECSTVEHLLIIPLNTQRPWQSIGLQSSNTSISAANDNFTLAPVNNQVNNTCNSPCFEICDNGIDDDFNGETDCEDAALANTCCCLSGPAPPALPADTSLCPGDSLLVAVSTLVGGSFSWSNGATDSVLVINTRGTYTLTIVDSCGRDTSASFTVTILPPTVPPDLGPDLTVCDNGVTTLDAGPGWESILWFDFTDARTATAFGAGDFWLRVTDSCGQVYTDTIAVTVEAATELDLGPADSSIVCGTDSITLSAPLGYDEYNWLPAGTLSCNDCPIVRVAVPPQGDSLTIFALGTTDNGCAAGDSIRIFSVPTPGQNITDSFCFETAYVFGDTSFTETGQYFLTDDCGTTDTLNLIELPQPPTLTAEISLCAGDSTLINGRWYRAPAVVTDTFTTTKGCDSLFVTNLTLFTPMTSPPELGADTVLCPGEVLRLDAGSGWDSIRWADGTSGMTTSTEIAGAFWLRVVDSCGIVFTDTLNVLIDSVPEINLGTADSSVVCGTDSITLTAPMGFVEYRWLPSESLSCNDCVNVRVAVPPPGDSITVSVVGITENDCAGGDSIRIFSTPALGQNISDSFCFETAYVFGDTSFTETGQYLLTDDCGTTDTLNLIELPQPPTLTAEVSLCAGDSTLINGRWYRAPAVVTDTFTTARGCDSLFVTNLALFTPATSPPELGTDTVLCPGDVLRLDAGSGWNSIRWADGTSGMTTSTEIAGAFWLRVVDSCGIVFTDTLNVLIGSVPEIDLGPADSSVVCGTDSITLTAPMGFAEYRWLPAGSLSCNDCPSVSVAVPPPGDSITVSVVGITENDCAGGDSIRIFSTPASGQNITDFFCFETAYVFGDTSFTATGQYLLTDDCGTTDTLNLIELPRLPVLSTVFSLCRGDSIRINGRWYVAPDTAVDTFTSVNGCDSFFVSNLDVFLTARTSETRAICANDSVQIGDRWYQAPATVTDTFPDVNGCDSFHTIELTLLAEDVFRQDTLRICAGDSIFLAGDWQTEADIYRDSFIAVAGCDSIIQTTLLVDVALDFELSTRFLACPAPDGEIGYLLIRNLTSLSSLTVNDTPVLLRDSVPLFPAERYALSLVDVNGCSRDTVINRADTDPEGNLAVSLPNLIRLNLGDSIQLTPELFGGADSLRYAWMPSEGLSCSDCATPWARPIVTTAYTLRVTDATGCTDTSLVRIVVDADAPVYVPTAFSPNADGMNDRLVVGFSAAVSRVERFEIYDRWGGVLYALTDLNPTEASSWGWNGESRGRPAVVGVYVWKMELRLASGQRRLLAGEVLLLR